MTTENNDWQEHIVAEDEISILKGRRKKIESFDELLKLSREANKDEFWPFIQRLSAECDKILEENGFPKAMDTVRHDGNGKWWLHPADGPSRPPPGERWQFMMGCKFTEKHAQGLSDSWYASRIGFCCSEALRLNQRGKIDQHIFVIVYQIAHLRTDWQWRRNHRANVIRGKKTKESAAAGGQSKSRQNEETRSKVLAKMNELIQRNHSRTRAAELAWMAGFGVSKDANLQTWKRHIRKLGHCPPQS